MDFQQIVREADAVSAEGFLELVKKTIKVLRSESGTNGNVSITGKLATVKPVGDALVIGDLHGDLESLAQIMEKTGFPSRMEQNKTSRAVFLGDYGDRGAQSPEVYFAVLNLKLAFPQQVVLLRGNHEGPTDLMASPHDLPLFLRRKFKDKWVAVYSQLRDLFGYLYNGVYVEERYLMLHGGLPSKLRSLQEIADANQLHPQKPFFEELLWNDPDEHVVGVFSSPRGAGNLFGKAVTEEVLGRLNVKILIRGHEPAGEGYKINHDGKVLTLFSRKGPPYYNAKGAYLEVPLAEKFESANQFLPYIHKF